MTVHKVSITEITSIGSETTAVQSSSTTAITTITARLNELSMEPSSSAKLTSRQKITLTKMKKGYGKRSL